jgi:choline transporter-like protein 2/4/5
MAMKGISGRVALLQIFFSVYEMAIDTILLSFCEDSESNDGHPRWAPPLLMEAIGEKYPPEQAADPYAPQKPRRH